MSYPLKVVVIKAHPDEAEVYAGGTCARLAESGAAIKFVSLTNGDAGHFSLGRKALRRRRAREAYAAARHLGVLDYEILDTHDGALFSTAKLRQAVVTSVRRWQADLVITFHDEGAGHSDNRAAGRIVREAAEFLINANVVPDVPALEQAPICLQMVDYWSQHAHRHDIAVPIDSTIEQKLLACHEHATQFYEFAPFERGFQDQVPGGQDWPTRRAFLLEHWGEFMYARPEMGLSGTQLFAESFQLAPYGRQVDAEAVRSILLAGA